MANTFPSYVKQRLAASGSGAAVNLLELQTINGNRYNWADATLQAVSALPTLLTLMGGVGAPAHTTLTYPVQSFVPWLLSAGPFKTYANTTTSTGQVTVQNLSGNTVVRDVSNLFSQNAVVGALVFYRQWLSDCEFASFSFMGRVDDAEVEADGSAMTLQLESLCCWANIDAPNCDLCPSCQNWFQSVRCGSTSPTPCNNDYGSCTSIERFFGVLNEWVGAALSGTQYVQPAPLNLSNPRVAG